MEKIIFSIFRTRLGDILAAKSKKGLSALFFGDDPGELEEALQSEFPGAKLINREDPLFSTICHALEDLSKPLPNLPLDLRGTPFQLCVWECLQKIPRGSTMSYSQIATQIGHPKAARAVGRACATNRIAIFIPCHRAIHADGSLSGYRWGDERKRTILKHEVVLRRQNSQKGI